MSSMDKNEYRKCEKINGEIFEQSPAEGLLHAMVMGNVFCEIKSQLKGSSWSVTAGNYTLRLSTDEFVVPDIMLIINDKKHITSKGYQGIPLFIAEIVGPLTRVKDRDLKKAAYAKLGVEEYWLIDLIDRKIEIYYLQTGEYILQESYGIEDKEITISLKNVSMVKITAGEIFSGICEGDNR